MQDKRTGQITASITPERIREALAAGHKVHVVGYDEFFDETLRGYVQHVFDFADGPNVAFIDETPGGLFEGQRVGLRVRDLTAVTIGA